MWKQSNFRHAPETEAPAARALASKLTGSLWSKVQAHGPSGFTLLVLVIYIALRIAAAKQHPLADSVDDIPAPVRAAMEAP